ncbi:MAG: RagB/SusD family nutrient uptake outer membrane protein, partial [Prevotellaceae bacterium]|nr:RagB/SusD family nutrient uptake outer membrane protein [Prevotellaceae bacterium]
MNRIKYIMALVLMPMLIASCSDSFLDEGNDPNRETEGTFWTSEANVMRALVAMYNPIRDEMYGYYGAYSGIWNNSMRADDLFPTRNEEGFAWQILTFTNTPETANDPWSRHYKSIQLANEFMHYAPGVEMDAATLKVMIGEAYFMRGFQYFLLQENYGGAIVRTQPASVDPEHHGWSSQEETLSQCEADFKAAIDALPVTRPATENGRITRGAAIAMLGKTYLWQGRYAEAKAQFELIMTAPYTYDLMENYADNFVNTAEFNKESVYEIDYGYFGNSGSTWGNQVGTNAFMGNNLANFFGPQLPSGGGWYKMQPSAHLVKEFVSEPRPA